GLGLARWSLTWLPALCVAGGLLVMLGLGRALNALMAGEQTAVTLGLDARRVRLWVFVCCSLLTGVRQHETDEADGAAHRDQHA
ncbi:iron chelate uptake ABC transporter family permease subunit, partial [Pseudomonas aeruginosa]